MGGGDLNLKKSWDPRRLDNQEKKWKLEEADRKERKRLAELKEERQEERTREEMRRLGEDAGVIEKKPKDRLDWMYKGPGDHVNPEDYLLGKEVDRAVLDKRSGKTKPNETQGSGGLSVGAVLGSSASQTIDAKDMARKMREDPLFAIKKLELNNRKELVTNPIRMKQLQQMLQSQVGSDKKKSKKGKKHKDKKRKKHKSDSEDDPTPKHSKRRVQDLGSPSDRHRGKYQMKAHNRKYSSSGEDSDEGHRRQTEQTLASLNKSRMKELLEREILQKHRGKKDRPESSSSESDSDEQESHSHRKRNRSAEQTDKSHSDERQRGRISSPSMSRRRQGGKEGRIPAGYGLQRGARSQRRSPSPSIVPPKHQYENRDKYGDRNRDRSPHARTKHHEKNSDKYGGDRSPSPRQKRDRHSERNGDDRDDKRSGRGRSHSRSPLRHQGRSTDKHRRSRSKSPQRQSGQRNTAPKRKLTAEEMERKRAEMMTNAQWRDDQRKSRVMTYEKEEQAEIEMEKKKSKNAEFVQPLKLPENSSVEDRIHRNIYNIQRTKAALDKNFAKR